MHNSYDSVSSYDSYGVRMNNGSNGSANLSTTLCSNSQDDLKPGSNNTLGRHHDPYRFTRSTQQPVDTKMSDYPKYRLVNLILLKLKIYIKLSHLWVLGQFQS